MSAIGVLVVDAGAFIKGAPLEKWSENVVTVREVVSEIRDVNTRRRLQVLPYDLSFREPSQEALYHGERWETWVSRGSCVSTTLKQPYKPHSLALVREECC